MNETRLTVPMIRLAIAKTRMILYRIGWVGTLDGVFSSTGFAVRCGCPLGIYAVSQGIPFRLCKSDCGSASQSKSNQVRRFVNKIFGSEYVSGFTHGFDYPNQDPFTGDDPIKKTPRSLEGYHDGKSAYSRLYEKVDA